MEKKHTSYAENASYQERAKKFCRKPSFPLFIVRRDIEQPNTLLLKWACGANYYEIAFLQNKLLRLNMAIVL